MSPFLTRQFFMVRSSPVNFGMAGVILRFVFDGMGPRFEMQQNDTWTPMQDYTNFRLAPEDLPHLTTADLNALVALFKQGVRHLDPNVSFTYAPMIG
jgi:hypothetical protein